MLRCQTCLERVVRDFATDETYHAFEGYSSYGEAEHVFDGMSDSEPGYNLVLAPVFNARFNESCPEGMFVDFPVYETDQ